MLPKMEMLKNLCRCCLSPKANVSIFDEKLNIEDKFLETTTIQVSLTDGLPQMLCKTCFNLMNTAYHFKTQCIKMDAELKVQMEYLLKEANKNNLKVIQVHKTQKNTEEIITGDINSDDEVAEEEDDDFGSNPLKQLEYIIKSEPKEDTNENEDDYYFVVVIDDEEKDKESDENSVAQIKKEPVEFPSNRFEDTIDSFLNTRNKIPDNVPAAILQHEEDDEQENNFIEMDIESSNREEEILPNTPIHLPIDFEENATIVNESNSVKTISANNLIKIVTETDPDGNIILKAGENITYLTEQNPDGEGQEEEVIVYEQGEDSPFQILSCDGELVIEYADESTTVNKSDENIDFVGITCDCGVYCKDMEAYEQHLATHSESHLCSLCGKGFESLEILTGHMLLHKVRGLYIMCPYCKNLIKRNTLTQHIKYGHNNIKTKCNVCAKTFANPNNLKRHMMIHSGIRQFECDICYKRFHQKITMQTHKLTHIDPFSCNQCDEVFPNKKSLDEHKEKNTCTKSKLIRIKEELYKTLKQEIKSTDNELLGYACTMCKKMFSLESALDSHVENTHMVNPMQLICQECGDVKISEKEMASHLLTHKNVRNKNMKRFECPSCGKGCPSKAMLLMHERVHTDERPYPCELCNSKFKTKTHLRTHQLTHTREKRFGCSICMKFFALKGNLVVHLRTHTGERPYVCNICADAFIDSKYLKKHKKKKHAINNLPWNQY